MSVVILRATTGEITKKKKIPQIIQRDKNGTLENIYTKEGNRRGTKKLKKKALKMQKTNRKITNTNPSLAAVILNVNIKHKGKDLQDGLKQKT